MKQWFKVVSLGIGIWALSLLWPHINQFLTPEVMLVSILGLAAISLMYLMWQDADQPPGNGDRRKEPTPSPPKLIQLNDHS